MPKEFHPLSSKTPAVSPSHESGSQLSPADKRDIAITEFFRQASRLLEKIEPLIDAAIADGKEARR